jgi:hypothetical protein
MHISFHTRFGLCFILLIFGFKPISAQLGYNLEIKNQNLTKTGYLGLKNQEKKNLQRRSASSRTLTPTIITFLTQITG